MVAMQRKVFLIFCLIISLCCLIEMAESGDLSKSSSSAVHIVYTEKPQDEQPEAYHIRTLASVLGSEEAAKEALIYSYKTAASGFSAKLTPEQVAEMSSKCHFFYSILKINYLSLLLLLNNINCFDLVSWIRMSTQTSKIKSDFVAYICYLVFPN